MVTSTDAFLEAEIEEKPTQIVEANVGIGLTIQDALEKPLSPRHGVYSILTLLAGT